MAGEMTATPKRKALEIMGDWLQFEPEKLAVVLKNTVFKDATDAEFQALVIVANQYHLNPILRQIYAFPKKGGGIQPVIGVDGWAAIANADPDFAGAEFEYANGEDGGLQSCTCRLLFKSGRAFRVTEWFGECVRNTEPWKQMPRRMLRHKAFIQAARLAFGLGNFLDEEEAATVAYRDMDTTPANGMTKTETLANRLKSQAASADDPKQRADIQDIGGAKEPSTPNHSEASEPMTAEQKKELDGFITKYSLDAAATAWRRKNGPRTEWLLTREVAEEILRDLRDRAEMETAAPPY